MSTEPKFFEYVEQYVAEVVDCSSQYGSDDRTSYTAKNIVGPPTIYPNHMDSTKSFAFRTFRRNNDSSIYSILPIVSERNTSLDYIDLFFERALIVTNIQIFETYYPGCVVAIRACYRDQPAHIPVNARGLYWVTLWNKSSKTINAQPVNSCILPSDKSQFADVKKARIFEPILSQIPLVPTDLIRIEFNCTLSSAYYAQIDAVRLKGYAPISADAAIRLQNMNATVHNYNTPYRRRNRTISSNINQSSSLLDAPQLLPGPSTLCLPVLANNQLSVSSELLPLVAPCENETINTSKAILYPLTTSKPKYYPRLTALSLLNYSTTSMQKSNFDLNTSLLLCLPVEVLVRIFSFLDLSTLCLVSSVCRYFHYLSDATLSRLSSINLQPYWFRLNDNSLLNLTKRMTRQITILTKHLKNPKPSFIKRRLFREAGELHELGNTVSVQYHTWDSLHRGVAQHASVLSGSPASSKNKGISSSFVNYMTGEFENCDTSLFGNDFEFQYTPEDEETHAPSSRLHKLNLSWCGNYLSLSTAGLNVFLSKACQNLTTLCLAACQIVNDECLLNIINTCGLLQELDLSSCQMVTSVGFIPLGRLIHLTWISLYRTQVDDQSLLNLANMCQNLRHVNVGSCTSIQNANNVIVQIASNNPFLSSLDLWRCRSFTSAGLISLADCCPNLTYLDLGWCIHIISQPSNCILILTTKCKRLKHLLLTGVRSIHSNDLDSICEHLCNSLCSLDLIGNVLVTEQSVENLLVSCKRLNFLDISFCIAVSLPFIDRLRKTYPHCCIMSNFAPNMPLMPTNVIATTISTQLGSSNNHPYTLSRLSLPAIELPN